MKRLFPLIVFLSVALISLGQNISVTFTGTGAADQIDSISATNLMTGRSVSFPGNSTLLLSDLSAVPDLLDATNSCLNYPNPFLGNTTVSIRVQRSQWVNVKVQNLVGQIVTSARAFLEAGENSFTLSLAASGIYLVNLATDQGIAGFKMICTDATGFKNRIQYLGHESNNHSQPELKSFQSGFALGYKLGDLILYRCKSGIFSTVLTDSPAASKTYEVEFSACSDPDGKNYPVVKIGDQTWTAENLAYLPEVSPSSAGAVAGSHYYVYGYNGSQVTDAKSNANYNTYGALYNWEAAQTACPPDWHLPSDAEWTLLADYLGSSAGGTLKETGTAHWSAQNTGATNETGFGALPGGNRTAAGTFASLGDFAGFWSATEDDSAFAMSRNLKVSNSAITQLRWTKKTGYSVRCLKGTVEINTQPTALFTISPLTGTTKTIFTFDASASTDAETPVAELVVRWDFDGDDRWDTEFDTLKIITYQYPTGGNYFVKLEVKDAEEMTQTLTQTLTVTPDNYTDPRDGNVYSYGKIGTQVWMLKNLAWLPSVSPALAGSDATSYYYVLGYDGTATAAAKANANYTTYGVLYNWDAAKAACPSGWHLPSSAEWQILTKFLGTDAGGQMKEAGTTHWLSPNTGANNISGFTALPGGYRNYTGGFTGLGSIASFWSSTGAPTFGAWELDLNYNGAGMSVNDNDKSYGLSVRCVRD